MVCGTLRMRRTVGVRVGSGRSCGAAAWRAEQVAARFVKPAVLAHLAGAHLRLRCTSTQVRLSALARNPALALAGGFDPRPDGACS
jgi:hypothetical protein